MPQGKLGHNLRTIVPYNAYVTKETILSLFMSFRDAFLKSNICAECQELSFPIQVTYALESLKCFSDVLNLIIKENWGKGIFFSIEQISKLNFPELDIGYNRHSENVS